MKCKDTMESPWGVLKINCIEIRTEASWRLQFSGHLLIRPPSPTSWPRTGFMAQQVSQPDIDVFFDEPRPIPSHGLVYLPTFIIPGWIWMVWVMNILNYSMFKSDLPSNRLKFCNLKIAPGATAIAWDREPHQQIHHSWQGVHGVVWFFLKKTSPTRWSKCTAMISTFKRKCSHFRQPPFENTGFCRTNQRGGLSTSSPIVDAKFLEIPSALRIDRMTLTDQDEPIEVLAAPVCRCGDQWEHQCINYGMSEPVQVLEWHSLNLLWKDGNVKSLYVSFMASLQVQFCQL